MSRDDEVRLDDIVAACLAIKEHLSRGALDDGMVFDAVRMRLIEIGEAVKCINPALLGTEPQIPWRDIARMRDHLAHRYFDTVRAYVSQAADKDIEPLLAAVRRMAARVTEEPDGDATTSP